MEEIIKVGEYVRTEYDGIGKILEVRYMPLRYVYDVVGNIAFTDDITKHSPNVIDLIEVGDYVNGHLVYSILIDNDFKGVQVESDHLLYHTIEEKDIDSIVTHEQFNSIKYVIGE